MKHFFTALRGVVVPSSRPSGLPGGAA